MKRLLALTSLSFFCLIVYCQQYEPYIKEGKIWKYYYECDGACGIWDAWIKYYFKDDTLIGQEKYNKLYGEIISYNTYAWGEKDTLYLAALLREDTIVRKVFIYYGLDIYSSSPVYNKEKVLFDFSLEVGDTLTSYSTDLYYPVPAYNFVVDKIDTVQLNNGKEVKRFYDGNIDFETEAVGSNVIDIDPRWRYLIYVFSITCVMDDNVHIYGNDCSGLTAIKNWSIPDEQIKVYPTKVSKELIIDSELKDATIFFYDTSGRYIFSKKINFGRNQIDFSGFPSGVYYYKISSDSNSSKGKIIKLSAK